MLNIQLGSVKVYTFYFPLSKKKGNKPLFHLKTEGSKCLQSNRKKIQDLVKKSHVLPMLEEVVEKDCYYLWKSKLLLTFAFVLVCSG